MKNLQYQKFLNKWKEVISIKPQTVGPLTPIYKKTASYLKIAPWRILIPLAFAAAILLAVILEAAILQIVSLLQKGF